MLKLEYHDVHKCVFLSRYVKYPDWCSDRERRVYVVNVNNRKLYKIEISNFKLEFLPCTNNNIIRFKVAETVCYKDFNIKKSEILDIDGETLLNNFDDLC